MTICPYDCSVCGDPSCRRDGCGRINDTIYVVCEGCGQPVACVNCLQLCMSCVLTSEREFSPVPQTR